MARAAPKLANRRSYGIGRQSTNTRRTQSVPRTESGRLLLLGVATKVSQALEPYTEGEVATALETNKDTAQSWCLGRRAPNSSFMLAMGKAIDEVGLMIAEEIDAGRFYGHGNMTADAVIGWATKARKAPGQEGAIARAILAEAAKEN